MLWQSSFVQYTLSCHELALRRRSGAQWDKQHGVDVERERLLARTRDAVARGLLAGNLWHTASNAEHARPMLQVQHVPFGSADSTALQSYVIGCSKYLLFGTH